MTQLENLPFKSRPWYQLWWDVWTIPGTDTFQTLLNEPNGGAGRGFLWILLTGILSGLAYSALMLISPEQFLGSIPAANRAMVQSIGAAGNFLCIPVSSLIGIALTAAIDHGLARLLGGKGNWDQLVFCFAAIQAPLVLFGALISLPVALLSRSGSSFGLLIAIFSILFNLVVSIYSTALYIMALRAVEVIGIIRAMLVILLPAILAIATLGCLFGGLIASYANQLR